MPSRDEIRNRFANIRVWKKGDQRAVHKPLLLLEALARCLRGEDRLVAFSEVDERLADMLIQFGPYVEGKPETYLPFWHLRTDGLWEIPGHEKLEFRKGKKRPKPSEFSKHDPAGGLPEDLYAQLKDDRALVRDLIWLILEEFFPRSQYQEILDAVDLEPDATLPEEPAARLSEEEEYETVKRKKRDDTFRKRILSIYEHRCAVCGFDLSIKGRRRALEAAHIRWHNYQGPNHESNGLALCSVHHSLFDGGAFTLLADLRLHVSRMARGESLEEWLLRFEGSTIKLPRKPAHQPGEDHIRWHWRQVFKGKVA